MRDHERMHTTTRERGAVPAPSSAGLAVRRIFPVKRRVRLREIVEQRSVIRVVAARDFKVKYKQSVLGPAWLVLQPGLLLAALVVAFGSRGGAASPGVPYVVFALVGLCVWSYFQASLVMGTSAFPSNIGLVRYSACPRIAFPVATLVASLPSLALTAGITVPAAA